ncbi:MAG: hypothetical protein LBF01_00190 [Bacteroidales bacterium]|jgi:hypothetical protein|nr:hypothetical protein [Bacteroidales bacterium]
MKKYSLYFLAFFSFLIIELGCEKEKVSLADVLDFSYSSCDGTSSFEQYIKYRFIDDSTIGFEHRQLVNCGMDSCNIKIENKENNISIQILDYGNDANCICPVIIRYKVTHLKKGNTYMFVFKQHDQTVHECSITFNENLSG